MAELSLDDLVVNRTLSAAMAATLRRAVEGRRSFLVFALPRLAGKSTVLAAMLEVARAAGARVRELGADGTDVAALAAEARGGYLSVPEVSKQAVTAGYVWGAPVRAAFEAIAGGTALAATLHADSAEDALAILRANDVPASDLSRLGLLVHLRSLGEDWQHPTRRVVVGVYEHGSRGLRPMHHWDEQGDRFVDVTG